MPSSVVESKISQQEEHQIDIDMGQLCLKSESVTLRTTVDTATTNTATTATSTTSNTQDSNNYKTILKVSDEPCPSPTSTVTSSIKEMDNTEGDTEAAAARQEISIDCSSTIEETSMAGHVPNSKKDDDVIILSKVQEEQVALLETQTETENHQDCISVKDECSRSESRISTHIIDATEAAHQGREKEATKDRYPNEGATVPDHLPDDLSKHSILVTNIPTPPPDIPPSSRASNASQSKPQTMHTMITQQQQALMMESGKLLEHLRKEVYKLRSQNSQLKSDFETLKGNNQRLMDANVSLGSTFDALNKHAKNVSKTNAKFKVEVHQLNKQIEMERKQSKERIDALELMVMELKDELNMKQETYIQEVHSRLHCQKVMTNIVDAVQERCKDHRLVEDVLGMSDECGL